jgi:hypothetical protein
MSVGVACGWGIHSEYIREGDTTRATLLSAAARSAPPRPPPPMSEEWTSPLSPAHPVYRHGYPTQEWKRDRERDAVAADRRGDALIRAPTAVAIADSFLHGPLSQVFGLPGKYINFFFFVVFLSIFRNPDNSYM